MSEELKDFELDSATPESPAEGGGSGTPRWPYLVAGLVIVALVVAFLLFRRQATEPLPAEEPPTVAEPVPAPETSRQRLDIGEVPALAGSDPWLREIAHQLSTHPQLVQWLITDDLIRTFVVAVDNLSEGVNPKKHVSFLRPAQPFRVEERDGRYFVDPATYDRYDLLIDVVESLDAQGVGELYAAIRPLCQEAYSELGYPGQQFDDALQTAVERVLAAPIPQKPVELEPKVTAYRFKDPALESLSPAARQLLRLGPDNLERLQAKVRELAAQIGMQAGD
jgi:hypothetical protein